MDSEAKKNYEVAYILSPAVKEDEVLNSAAKLSTAIEEAGGMVRRVETPKKRRLAYPIEKQTTGYFAWTTFTAAPAAVAMLDKKVKEIPEVLRHLIVEEEVETRVPYIRPAPLRRAPTLQPIGATPAADAQPEEKLDLEALDKKLEEILGK